MLMHSLLFKKTYANDAVLLVTENREIHMDVPRGGTATMLRDYRQLVKQYGVLYTRNPITDLKTRRLNSRLGGKVVKYDFAFRYYMFSEGV